MLPKQSMHNMNYFNILLATIFLIPSVLCGYCPKGCRCTSNPPTASCHSGSLKSIPILLNPRIKSLTLIGNAISSILLDELSLYTELEALDLSNNQLRSIERGAFYRLRQLKSLKLNGNQLHHLGVDLFIGLDSLTELDLSNNVLSRVPTTVFSELRRLEVLNLSANMIGSISPGSFTGLDSLKELHLANNQITEVPVVALQPLAQLSTLDLSNNLIPFLEVESFVSNPHLEFMSLSHNIIGFVEDDTFFGLNRLRHLNLSYNELHHLPTLSFRNLPEVTRLSVSGNNFASLPTSGFEGLSNLQALEISDCPLLKSVEMNAFSGLPCLVKLQLSSNAALSRIDRFAFELATTEHLIHVDLSSNNLTSLDTQLLPWYAVLRLSLGGNPWDCSCNSPGVAQWISEIAEETDALYKITRDVSSIPVCASPEELFDIPLAEIVSEMEQCASAQETSELLVTVAVLLTCLLLSTLMVFLVVRFRKLILSTVLSTERCCGELARLTKQYSMRKRSTNNSEQSNDSRTTQQSEASLYIQQCETPVSKHQYVVSSHPPPTPYSFSNYQFYTEQAKHGHPSTKSELISGAIPNYYTTKCLQHCQSATPYSRCCSSSTSFHTPQPFQKTLHSMSDIPQRPLNCCHSNQIMNHQGHGTLTSVTQGRFIHNYNNRYPCTVVAATTSRVESNLASTVKDPSSTLDASTTSDYYSSASLPPSERPYSTNGYVVDEIGAVKSGQVMDNGQQIIVHQAVIEHCAEQLA